MLGYLNWLAPCLVKSNVQVMQAALIGTLASSPGAMGLVLMPIFTYTRGQLWLSENVVLKALCGQNLNLDVQFMLPFKERLDTRDGRPATLTGRLLSGLGSKDLWVDSHWQHCSLLDKRGTEEATQLHTSNMVALEEYDSDALPSSCNGSDNNHNAGSIRGPKRYEQIGVDACLKLLDSTMDGLTKAPTVGGLLIIEANLTTGDMLEAFIQKASASSLPSYFFGVCADAGFAEWADSHVVTSVANKLKDGVFTMAGVEKQTVSDDIGAAPERPQMKALIMDVETNTLKIPEQLLKDWGAHQTFGKPLSDLLAKMQTELGYASPLQSTGVESTVGVCSPSPLKKRKDGSSEASPSGKRRKVDLDPNDIVKSDTLQDPILMTVKIANVKGAVSVEMRMGNVIGIKNDGPDPITIKAGSVVLGFGKITWKRLTEQDVTEVLQGWS